MDSIQDGALKEILHTLDRTRRLKTPVTYNMIQKYGRELSNVCSKYPETKQVTTEIITAFKSLYLGTIKKTLIYRTF